MTGSIRLWLPGLGPAALTWLVLLTAAPAAAAERYRMVTETSTRTSLRHVHDRLSGQWVRRECDLRLPIAAPLGGAQLDSLRGTHVTAGSLATIGPRGNWRISSEGWHRWRFDFTPREDDLQGRAGLAVALVPDDREPSNKLTLVFVPEAMTGSHEPDVWGAWFAPRRAVKGAMSLLNPRPDQATPDDVPPFEMRCRLRLNGHNPYEGVGVYSPAMLKEALDVESPPARR